MTDQVRPLIKQLFLILLASYTYPLLAQDTSTDTSTIDTVYHYWIKFPADVSSDCVSEFEIPGIEYEELGCDLLAIDQSDEFFVANEDSACYKMLRTYQIINWCEYDGQAAPVVVGRDWDNWNFDNPGRCGAPLPNGNGKPGDSDIYVYVQRNISDTIPDTVWYDADNNPFNAFPDNPETEDSTESYFWRVISGDYNPKLESYYEGNCSTWAYDFNQSDSDINDNLNDDDNDLRYGSFGFWIYTQHIKVYDNITPELSIDGLDEIISSNGSTCSADVSFNISLQDSCSNRSTSINIMLDYNIDGVGDEDVTEMWNPESQIFNGTFGHGNYQIIAVAGDGCGNITRLTKQFKVIDGVAPAPFCLTGLSISLNQNEGTNNGSAFVQANIISGSIIFDCSGQESTQQDPQGRFLISAYSLNRVGDSPDRNQTAITFSCEDLDTPDVEVELHAWDEAGNHDFCRTTINIRSDSLTCLPIIDTMEVDTMVVDTMVVDTMAAFNLIGHIFTEDTAMLKDVEVSINGDTSLIAFTDESGAYEIRDIPENSRIKIIPSLEANYMNGVSTLDLIRIRKYILGEQVLTSPYQLIAADIDNNGRINLLDMIRMQKLILGIDGGFSSNNVWRFIPSEYLFTNPNQPWQEDYPETIDYEFGEAPNQFAGDFIAIKIGDVNGSANTQLDSRSAKSLAINSIEQNLTKGEVYNIPLYLKDLNQIEGLQFTLGWDTESVEILDIIPGVINQQSLAYIARQQMITSAWVNDGLNSSDQALFSLKIRAKQDTRISKALELSDRITNSEAYYPQEQVLGLHLAFGQQANELDYQINNNPFREQALIQFSRPVNGIFSIYNLNGQLILQQKLDKAFNFDLNKEKLNGPGTYIFNLQEDNTSINGKFIHLR